jgi:hypothetical protein
MLESAARRIIEGPGELDRMRAKGRVFTDEDAAKRIIEGSGELDRGVAKGRADVRGEGSAARKQYKGRSPVGPWP